MKQDSSSGYTGLRDGAAVVDRADVGRLLLTGADRRSYLQGLLTNDIEALAAGTGCYATMLTAQGRMMTDMRVLELGDAVLLDVPAQVAGAIRDHLERFVFSEDVQVEDVSATRVELGLYGPRALEVLRGSAVEGVAPSTLFAITRVRMAGAEALLVHSDEIGIPGYDIITAPAGLEPIRAALLGAGAVLASPLDVDTVRIESGRPRFGADTDVDTIPLEAGLEDRAISRSKGCYVGQEVIVRVQDRGHGRVARRLVGLTLPADAALPTRGASIAADQKDVGRVTSSAFSPVLARPIALGYLHRDYVAPGTAVTIAGAGDAIVTALPLVPFKEAD